MQWFACLSAAFQAWRRTDMLHAAFARRSVVSRPLWHAQHAPVLWLALQPPAPSLAPRCLWSSRRAPCP